MSKKKKLDLININIHEAHRNFDIFTRALIGSNDVDPTYPVIKDIVNHFNFEHRWFTFLYVSFYSIESAIKIAKIWPNHKSFSSEEFIEMRKSENFKFGYERRGLRNINEHAKHLSSVCKLIPSITQKIPDQLEFRRLIETLPQNGGWASFKTAEIFEKSFDYQNLIIKDLGISHRDVNSNSDGPIPSLRLLTGWDIEYDETIKKPWNKFGSALAKKYNVSIGVIETSLCKYIKLYKANYFVGHDIAEFIELKDILGNKLFNKIMKDNFNEELFNFEKFPSENKKKFLIKSEIVNNKFAKDIKSVDTLSVLIKTI